MITLLKKLNRKYFNAFTCKINYNFFINIRIKCYYCYFFDKSITFPFSITNNFYVPEYRLHAIRLATFSSFIYFGTRYLFLQSSVLYPIQFMGIFLFNLGIVSAMHL